MAEANEPPYEAARRELREVGITPVVGALLVVDCMTPHDPWDDSLMFVFDGGVPPDEQVVRLRVNDGELRGWELVTLSASETLLRPHVHQRLVRAVEAVATGSTRYFVLGSRTGS